MGAVNECEPSTMNKPRTPIMKKLVVALLFFCAAVAQAQKLDGGDKEKEFQKEAAKGVDTTKVYGWNLGAGTGLNLSQVSYKDWSAGGQNSLAWGFWFKGSAEHRAENTRWLNGLKLAYGQTKNQGQEMRKTDDEIYFESMLIYLIGSTINPYASATFRTQFAPGYLYPDNLPRNQISAFFDPAYLTQSVGMAYTPSDMLTIRLGVGAREILTSSYNQFADDPATPEVEKTRVNGGLEGVVDFRWPFAENMVFLSRLESFANFNDFVRPYARWDNSIVMKVNTLIAVNFDVQLISDPFVSPKTQIKQALSVGISYTLL